MDGRMARKDTKVNIGEYEKREQRHEQGRRFKQSDDAMVRGCALTMVGLQYVD